MSSGDVVSHAIDAVHCGRPTPVPEASQPIPRAVGYMREHLRQPVTVAELAAVAGFSPYHFLRLFRRATGHTPHRYLILLRIAEVTRLLERGVTVAQAARQCGFSSTAHLSAVFLRETGVRPSRWHPPASEHGSSDREPGGRRSAVR
jgi:AraC-like DNA-binding protein